MTPRIKMTPWGQPHSKRNPYKGLRLNQIDHLQQVLHLLHKPWMMNRFDRPQVLVVCTNTQCHMAFLTNAGLVQYVQQIHSSVVEPDRMPQVHRKICHDDGSTDAQCSCTGTSSCSAEIIRVSHMPGGYRKPCKYILGVNTKPSNMKSSFFCRNVSRHYFGHFIMEQTLITHFKRGSCPVLTYQWARKIFFGPAESESMMS